MAFSDTPIVDNASKNNNLAELKLESHLNQHSGFICRQDIPDKGCDYDVELITNGRHVSNWRFAIQLKSIEKLSLVANDQLISHSFETSRLGYLIRRIPAMGILILYSLEKDLLYFDYVDAIYDRLMEERDSDDWKNNDHVNIRIPINNILDSSAASRLHEVFEKRFEQATLMQLSQGEKYNLPAINLTGECRYDFHNTDHLKQLLKEYGLLLLSRYDLQFVFDMVSKIPHLEICADKSLLLVAGISFGEVGKHADSVFFLSKALKRTDLSSDDNQMIAFAMLKNNLALGIIDNDTFVLETQKLKSNTGNAQNEICLEINITFFELLKTKTFHSIPENLIHSIESVFAKIKDLQTNDNTKWLLEIWNAENFSVFISNIRHKQIAELKIRESLENELSIEEKKKYLIFLFSLQQRLFEIIGRLNKIANDTDNKLLKGYAIALHTRFIIAQEIDFIAYNFPQNNIDGSHEKLFANHIDMAILAYNNFLELSYYKDAYQSLCYILELLEISRVRYHYKSEININSFLKRKEGMEQALEIKQYSLVIPPLLHRNSKPEIKADEDSMRFLKDMDNQEIENLAKTSLISLKLPIAHLTNIINEMKAYRLFHNRSVNGALGIFQIYDEYRTAQNAYKEPVKFVLRSKDTGIETNPSSNMEELLQLWGL